MSCSECKCKCVPRPDTQGCERCHRLNKPCLPGDSTRKRNARKKDATARIAQLEGKLDGLVDLLRPVLNAPNPGGAQPLPTLTSIQSPYGTEASTSSSSAFSPSTFRPSPEETEECLGVFRNHMLKYFPFLHLSDDVQWLREQRPFLFLCIISASSRSTQRKIALAKDIKQALAQRIILENRGVINIDLLLGLLTFIAWGHDQLLNGTPTSLSRFTQLAMTLVFDLRLNKPPPADTWLLPGNTLTGNFSSLGSTARSLEARRAVLACFVMSSIASAYFGQIDAMQWTPYMDECLGLLSQNQECSSDQLFAHQVRIQLFMREIESARGTTVPPAFFINGLRSKLDGIKASVSGELKQDEILLATFYHAEVSVGELVLSKDSSGFPRLEHLYACLTTVKSALDNFFKLPSAEYAGFSFPFFTQLSRYIAVLYKLSTLNDPNWDTSLVRSTVDLLLVLDQVISNLEAANVTGGDSSTDGVIGRTARLFSSVRMWCGAKFGDGTGGGPGGGTGNHESQAQAPAENAMLMEPMLLQSLDDAWVNDILTYGTLEGQELF